MWTGRKRLRVHTFRYNLVTTKQVHWSFFVDRVSRIQRCIWGFFPFSFLLPQIFGCSKWMGPRHTKLLNMTTIFCGSNADPPWGLEGLLLRGLWFWQWCIRWRSDVWMIGFGTKKFRSQRKRIFGSSVIKERFWELDDDIHCCFLKNVTDCWLQVG